MAEALLRNESPAEYFKELVETAMEHQHVAVCDLTSFYLVNLLTGFVHFDRSATADEEPLGIRLARALQTGGSRQRDGLREVGDRSLFISGFFADSLNRSLVDIDYYIQLGECAYASLARHGDPALGDVFDELAARRSQPADVSGSQRRSALTELGPSSVVRSMYGPGSRRRGDSPGGAWNCSKFLREQPIHSVVFQRGRRSTAPSQTHCRYNDNPSCEGPASRATLEFAR